MRIKEYSSYKDSHIDWVGKIPSHWKTLRTTDLSYQNKIKNIATVEKNLLSLSYGNIIEKDYDTAFGLLPASFETYQIVKPGTIILRLTDLQNDKKSLRVGLAKVKGIITSAYLGLVFNKEIDSFFMYYLLYSFDILKVFYSQGGSMRQSMKFDDFKSIQIIVPLLKEQTAIANYLNTKTQLIDSKVSLLEKKIGYYQELRKSLINDTVTHGFNKSVKLEQNELGFKTPTSWFKYRLKDLGKLFSGLSGKSGDDFNQDDNPDNKGFIPFTNIANNTYLKRDHLGTVVVAEGERQNKVRQGDIFFLMSSEGYEDIGKTAVLAENIEETYLNSFCKGYRVNAHKCNPFYLNYLMLSDYYRQILIIEGKGFTRINLKMEKVNDFLVYIPDSLTAQEEIVQFLDTKLDTIAKIIKNVQTQITTLKELRKTLINDVVTGKIKVV